jgi:hypothetical protein
MMDDWGIDIMFLGAVNDEAPESMRDLVQHRGT